MRIALIKSGVVQNVVESALGAHPDFVEVQSQTANIGDSWDGVKFSAPYVALVQPVNVSLVPDEVTPRQAQIALAHAGLLDDVESLMSSLPASSETKISWLKAQTFKRYSSMVVSMGAALGLTELDLDNLFIAASKVAD